MKLPLRSALFFALLGVALPGFGPLRAAPEPGAAATVAASPEKVVDAFFVRLQEGRVDAAYDEMLKGTKIAESTRDVATLKSKTREAIQAFGEIGGHDLVETKNVGPHLMKMTCISLGKSFPLRWRFYFYEAGDAWKLIDIRISDRLADMFGETAPAASMAPGASPAKTAP